MWLGTFDVTVGGTGKKQEKNRRYRTTAIPLVGGTRCVGDPSNVLKVTRTVWVAAFTPSPTR